MNKNISTKKGMSFVEMIIAIAIFSLLMVGISMFFAKSWKNYNYVMDTSSSSISAKQTIDNMVNIIRKARNADNGNYPIKSADDNDLIIYSDYDKDGITEKLHYYLNEENLMLGISKPSGMPLVYPSGDSNVVTIVENVINGSQPIFQYYDGSNNIIGNPSISIAGIRMIKISLTIKSKTANNLNIESFASIRNLNEHDTIQ